MINNICIIGLGYVGLPLAVEFAKKYKTIGYDIDKNRVSSLKSGLDLTKEVSNNDLKSVLNKNLVVTDNYNDISESNIYIITVPTPTDINKRPDLEPLKRASRAVAEVLKKNNYVIYESTVYPGVTEEICIPILEKHSQLKLNKDFFVGYSPERINPGDKFRTLTKIKKVTSGSDDKSAIFIDKLYKSIIKAGTYLATSIKVAEASKVIENSQRDINIAFVNELAKIFNKLEIDTNEVLEAAGTKWNFLPFKPGLVGGHCIGVDPYYLAQKAQESGYYPEIILAGRRINDSMGSFVSGEIIKIMLKSKIQIKDSNVLILGFSFKENCPDFRNTKVYDIYQNFKEYGMNVDIYDPWVDINSVKIEYKIQIFDKISKLRKYDAIILAVGHNSFLEIDFNNIKNKNSVVFDIKGFLPREIINGRL